MSMDDTNRVPLTPTGPVAPVAPPAPIGPPGRDPVVSRDGLRRLSRGLIAYGVVGLLVAALGLAAMVWINGRIESLGDRVSSSVDELVVTLDRTAVALDDAATTAGTFTTTIEQSAEALSAAADTIAGVRGNLETLESVLRAVDILGLTPLGPAADAVGGIANAIEGLDTRLASIADSLEGNQAALAANAESLQRVADSTAAMADRLRSGVVEASLDDVQAVLVVVLLLMVAWTSVPAFGALGVGIWLRRELDSGPPAA